VQFLDTQKKKTLIMNKKYVLGFLFLLNLSSCSIDYNYNEYKISNVSLPISDTLIINSDDVTSFVKILINGNINGVAYIEFERGVGRFHKIKLTGKVNEIYIAEWYEPKLHFKYTPELNVIGDSLNIKYRMD
jgi:hypothetical protein